MEITRKKVRLGPITTFVDPRSDLVLDKKARIYLHYLPKTGPEARNKNSLKYRMIKHASGYFIKFIGFYNYETAAKNFLQKLVGPDDYGPRYQGKINKVIHRVPYRARDIIEELMEGLEIKKQLLGTSQDDELVKGTENWKDKVTRTSYMADFETRNGVIPKSKPGLKPRFSLVVALKGEEKFKIALLDRLSKDTINDITIFNALAEDYGIELKVRAIDRNLEEPSMRLFNEFHVSEYNKRSDR